MAPLLLECLLMAHLFLANSMEAPLPLPSAKVILFYFPLEWFKFPNSISILHQFSLVALVTIFAHVQLNLV